jgi:hypothetical protein
MLDFFGAKDGAARTHQVSTKEELEAVLTRPELQSPKGVHVSLSFPQQPPSCIDLFSLLLISLGLTMNVTDEEDSFLRFS